MEKVTLRDLLSPNQQKLMDVVKEALLREPDMLDNHNYAHKEAFNGKAKAPNAEGQKNYLG